VSYSQNSSEFVYGYIIYPSKFNAWFIEVPGLKSNIKRKCFKPLLKLDTTSGVSIYTGLESLPEIGSVRQNVSSSKIKEVETKLWFNSQKVLTDSLLKDSFIIPVCGILNTAPSNSKGENNNYIFSIDNHDIVLFTENKLLYFSSAYILPMKRKHLRKYKKFLKLQANLKEIGII